LSFVELSKHLFFVPYVRAVLSEDSLFLKVWLWITSIAILVQCPLYVFVGRNSTYLKSWSLSITAFELLFFFDIIFSLGKCSISVSGRTSFVRSFKLTVAKYGKWSLAVDLFALFPVSAILGIGVK